MKIRHMAAALGLCLALAVLTGCGLSPGGAENEKSNGSNAKDVMVQASGAGGVKVGDTFSGTLSGQVLSVHGKTIVLAVTGDVSKSAAASASPASGAASTAVPGNVPAAAGVGPKIVSVSILTITAESGTAITLAKSMASGTVGDIRAGDILQVTLVKGEATGIIDMGAPAAAIKQDTAKAAAAAAPVSPKNGSSQNAMAATPSPVKK